MLIAAIATVALFAPPEGRRLHVSVEEVRTVGKDERRFTAQHDIVFRRVPDGWIADVTAGPPRAVPADAAGKRFARAAAMFAGRTLRFHLDGSGQVRAVDDQAALWQLMASTLAALPRPAGANVPNFAAMPPETQLRLLADPLLPVIAAEAAAASSGTKPATLRSVQLSAEPMTLTGTRTVTRKGDEVTLATVASGSAHGTTQQVERTLHVDAASGLLREEIDVQTATAGADRQTIIKSTRLTPVS